jgi:hypothetical protein
MAAGFCNPIGIALDKKLNVYYADFSSAVVVKCTYASGYQSCKVIEKLSGNPWGLYLDSKGNIWVTDASCAGNVWKNGKSLVTLNDAVEGITNSSSNPSKTQHLYIGVTDFCGTYLNAFIFDLTDHNSLPSPFSGPNSIPAISTTLVFSSLRGAVYQDKDKV